MKTLLAVPSCLPGGLDAGMGMHFGHCDIYTLVEIEDGKILKVSTMDNPPHQQGGCLAPVQLLAQAGVKALLAGDSAHVALLEQSAEGQQGARKAFLCKRIQHVALVF